ncbi:MAG: threonine synthase [Pseudomonadota bacterium]|nr:threonine synthase [Pseudomonadota bacterium]
MKYRSTRGRAPSLAFDDVILEGLAKDGGLYVPETWHNFSKPKLEQLATKSYKDLTVEILSPYIAGVISLPDLQNIVEEAYRPFTHPAIAPIRQLADNEWLLELYSGPTLAFKDYALQLVGKLFEHVLKAKGNPITIVGATSGDTGSAAIEACRDKDLIQIFMLHPKDRISEIQRRQMTTVKASNVHNIAISGTFDDCQNIVKVLFADNSFNRKYNLAAVNSINWARILAQVVYYFWAGLAVGTYDRKVVFSVPTGNFGNVFAGYAAWRMGLPIEKLIVGSNRNDILTRFFNSGQMAISKVVPTISPSMDIQVSSNFERLLFEYCECDGEIVTKLMEALKTNRSTKIRNGQLVEMLKLFESYSVDDEVTKFTINEVYNDTGMLIDPHTAVGLAAAKQRSANKNCPVITIATAHPGKFPEAVELATNIRPNLPDGFKNILNN